ncbi:MAG: P-II family nitrogen regulator [Eubacteriales bacterium]|nr:P-II family nitrogen regulator [Eubacteriales bacterium]MDD4584187.1 P-II family nitrogen regulator [Eubacteriales bacterium]
MNKERKYDLIITVLNRGFADTAVEAAKQAGAQGGTIFYARGTGIHEVERFFGVTIQPEKEVIFNLVKHELTKEIMQSIVEKAGLNTPGRGLSFAVPVEEALGIAHDLNGLGDTI